MDIRVVIVNEINLLQYRSRPLEMASWRDKGFSRPPVKVRRGLVVAADPSQQDNSLTCSHEGG